MGTLSFKADGVLVDMFSQLMQSPDANTGTLLLGINGTKADKHHGPSIRLRFNGVATGDFPCAPGDLVTEMDYDADQAVPASAATAAQGTGSCSFHVTSFGAVGEPIVGTFEGMLQGPVNVVLTEGSINLIRCK